MYNVDDFGLYLQRGYFSSFLLLKVTTRSELTGTSRPWLRKAPITISSTEPGFRGEVTETYAYLGNPFPNSPTPLYEFQSTQLTRLTLVWESNV